MPPTMFQSSPSSPFTASVPPMRLASIWSSGAGSEAGRNTRSATGPEPFTCQRVITPGPDGVDGEPPIAVCTNTQGGAGSASQEMLPVGRLAEVAADRLQRPAPGR